MCQLLRKIAASGLTGPIALVLDNARYQRNAAVQALASQLGLTLLYLPSYSPNLNLIERLWKFLICRALYGRYHPTIRRVPSRDPTDPRRPFDDPCRTTEDADDAQFPAVRGRLTFGRVRYSQLPPRRSGRLPQRRHHFPERLLAVAWLRAVGALHSDRGASGITGLQAPHAVSSPPISRLATRVSAGRVRRAGLDVAGRRPVGPVRRVDAPAQGPVEDEVAARRRPVRVDHQPLVLPQVISVVIVYELPATALLTDFPITLREPRPQTGSAMRLCSPVIGYQPRPWIPAEDPSRSAIGRQILVLSGSHVNVRGWMRTGNGDAGREAKADRSEAESGNRKRKAGQGSGKRDRSDIGSGKRDRPIWSGKRDGADIGSGKRSGERSGKRDGSGVRGRSLSSGGRLRRSRVGARRPETAGQPPRPPNQRPLRRRKRP